MLVSVAADGYHARSATLARDMLSLRRRVVAGRGCVVTRAATLI